MPIFTRTANGGRAAIGAHQITPLAYFFHQITANVGGLVNKTKQKALGLLLLFAFCLLTFALRSQPGCDLGCKQNVPIAMFDGCARQVNGDFLTAVAGCVGPKTVEIYDQNNVMIGDWVHAQHVGKLLNVKVTSNYWGSTCWGSIVPTDLRAPKIVARDTTISCLVDPDPAVFVPSVSDECSAIATLTHIDSVTTFDCQSIDFTGNFRPACWTFCLPGADGAIDTSGAPFKIKLSGAKASMPVPMAKYRTTMKIRLPAPGYIQFDWKMYGTGNPTTFDALYFTVGDSCWLLSGVDTLQGTYTSKPYPAGTVISIEQVSNGDALFNTSEIFNFKFFTTAAAVIHRCWTATDIWGNAASSCQFITLNRASTTSLIWPKNLDDQQLPSLECGTAVTDAIAGLPLVDDDGNPATTNDQHAVNTNSSFCSISVVKTDQIFPLCGGSYALARTWTAVDDCSANVATHVQLIKVLDKKAPVLDASQIGQLVFPTSDVDCKSTVLLQNLTATDDCSAVTTSANWNFGSGFGPFQNVPTGTHQIKFTATDACGNSTSFSTQILVKDLTEPAMICQQNVVASIGSDGTATVFPSNFDNGVTDNCCLNLLEIKRLDIAGQDFLDKITYTPADISPIQKQVELRAKDCNGNSNSCVVNITIQDKIVPNLTCPPNVTTDCATDFGDLTQFGTAVSTDNSGQNQVSYSFGENLNGCGIGLIARSWTATDGSGNTNVCSQTIFVENQTPWDGATEIAWPADFTTTDCTGAADLEPANLPSGFDAPIWATVTGCESPAVAHSDEIFLFSGGFCTKILREWTVIDWCNYSPGGPTGIWKHTQTIAVMDNQPPVFVNPPADLTVGILSSNCQTTVVLPQLSIDDCQPNPVLSVSSSLGTGFGPFQNVAPGDYPVHFTATDGCGNAANLTVNLHVFDAKAPTVVAKNGLAASLIGSNGQASVTLDPAFFNQNSSDNCTAAGDLLLSFSQNTADNSRTFTCADLGQQAIQLWATDAAGNSAFVTTYILIQDNSGACQIQVPFASISGQILTETGLPVGQANVTCSAAPALVTAPIGLFSFANLPTNAGYELTVDKNINVGNGVTTFDANRIEDHTLGILINSPYKIIAADADSDGQITQNDVDDVKAIILQTAAIFPQNSSWRFVPQSYVFQNPTNPFPFDEEIVVQNLTNNLSGQNFIGMKIGDVNNSVDPANLQQPAATDDRSGPDTLHLTATERIFTAGENFSLPVNAKELDALESYQFTFDFDVEKLEFLGVLNASLKDFGFKNMSVGGINHLWMRPKNAPVQPNQLIFNLLFKAKTDGVLSQSVGVSSKFAEAAAYKLGETVEQKLPIVLNFNEPETPTTTSVFDENMGPVFHGISPNPMSEKAVASFNLPTAGPVKLTVSDAVGRVVFSEKRDFLAGFGQFPVEIGTAGVYFYKIEMAEKCFGGRLIRE